MSVLTEPRVIHNNQVVPIYLDLPTVIPFLYDPLYPPGDLTDPVPL